jgi:general stress protein 26
MLPWSWAVEQLVASRNYWISTVRPDGSPHAMPAWGVSLDETVYFGTAATSRKGRNLKRDARVVVHVESGDDAVILEGQVEEIRLDQRIADAFKAKYDWRPDPAESEGLWLRVRPRIAWAWKESDYPNTATRFDF